jgi:hypothetical protein
MQTRSEEWGPTRNDVNECALIGVRRLAQEIAAPLLEKSGMSL